MKKVAILLFITSSFVFAQNTYVPDDKFEQALIDLGYDTTLDDSVVTANISGVTTLELSNKEISDLTGIEAFTSLAELYLHNNKLTSLDVSSNTNLTHLNCDGNQLTSLDVSKNTALTEIILEGNQLTSLDISSNTSLVHLNCISNKLTSLDVSNNTALTWIECSANQLTSLDVSKNTALTKLHCANNQLTSLDVSSNTALTYLYCDSNQLTSLDLSNNTALTELENDNNQLTTLDLSSNTALIKLKSASNQLTSLDVSNNTALTYLKPSNNQLTSLDVSKNTALETLDCSNNKLTSLDVSANTALTYLDCWSNKLTSLDVSSNTALKTLELGSTQLTSLDVSSNTALTYLGCGDSQLTSLDVSRNTALTQLYCNNNQLTYLNMRNGVKEQLSNFNVKGNSSLTCIETLDPAYATTNWTNIDAGVTFSVICGAEAVTTWHVATTGSDASGSGTETSPLATIQTGINAASSGDTVSVAAGTYVENVFLENPDGGVRKNISVIGENKNTTIIDGNQNGSVFYIISDGSLFLKNFTIQNGTGIEGAGGGVKISSGTAVLENLIIKDNAVGADGGGVWSWGANLTIKYSKIISNAAGNFGGGIIGQQTGGSITLKDVYVENNKANQGGGIYARQTPVYFSGTVSLLNNHASTEGGGISFDGATPNQLLTNLVIADNTAGSRGAGIVISNSSFSIKNSTIVNNKANGNAGGLFVSHGTVLDVDNSIFWNNSPQQVWVDDNSESDPSTLSFSYSDVQGGESGIPTNGKGTITWGTGNIDKNPSFVDSVADNFMLADWSHLIGAGRDGNDIGAFENQYDSPQNAPPVLTALSDVSVNEDESITITLEAINADSADNDAITFSASSEKSEVKLSMGSSSGKLDISADENWNGLSKISVEATDGTAFDYGNFTVTFLPVNDKPIIASIASDTTNEETAKSIQVTASDIDGDELSISATTSDNHVVPSVSGMTLTLTPAKDFVGNTLVTVIVNDGSLTDTVSYQFTVLNVNDSPVLSEIKDQRIAEDTEIMVKVVATDVDDTSLSITGNTGSAGISAAFSGNDLTLKPEANWNGSSVITVYASDGKDMDSTKFNLTVDPMQDTPYNFDWVSTASDSINITQSNLTDTYDLKWNTSDEVDGETIDYLISASVGQFPAEMINETADTSMTIAYQDIIDNWYPNLAMLPRATLKFSVSATDGIDTVNVTGDDRVLFVNRYEYLSTEGEGVPVEFALHENYPNPFNPTTTLRFDLPDMSDVNLTIYNMLGQRVRTFNMNDTPAGYHSIKWNATNDYGEQVGAGVYLYQLQAKDFVKTRKMVLLK